jgi:hypothetical protein
VAGTQLLWSAHAVRLRRASLERGNSVARVWLGHWSPGVERVAATTSIAVRNYVFAISMTVILYAVLHFIGFLPLKHDEAPVNEDALAPEE